MSGTVNKVILVGRLGRDPELNFSKKGTAICKLSIATNNHDDTTEWHRVVVFGKQADACGKYLTKGREVYLEGRIKTDKYEKDGVERYSTEIIANEITFLSGGRRNDGGSAPAPEQSSAPEDDELPF